MRQRLEIPPIPHRIHGIELTQQFQQHVLAAGRICGGGADPACQPIRMHPLLRIDDLLWCRSIMDWDRLPRITARHHPWSSVHVHDQHVSSFPEKPNQIRKNVPTTTDIIGGFADLAEYLTQ
jgi:anaerobic glycerol-3-phosphate dehydrogenase